ncbi:hypothetical protein BN8_00840 [Fibrisoma limi BUZ 3]|uniref:Uncharacterized protein n=1 Tax=Fibrisoma limi BUZ 3 TaxID=1185876 RepID=I2GDA8_9BACT|nr:hypothetical protein BN8_00840 [Fibrisoma limi BUZ 3]
MNNFRLSCHEIDLNDPFSYTNDKNKGVDADAPFGRVNHKALSTPQLPPVTTRAFAD